jgi:hypothetical protein
MKTTIVTIHTSRLAQFRRLLQLLPLGCCLGAQAQGTAFTYQGRLNNGGSPASGIYDLRFAIYDSTNLPGVLIAGPVTNSATAVSNGLFTVTVDFGATIFDGSARWLEIAARSNSVGSFAVLNPRQALTPAPYALFSAASGSMSNGVIQNPAFLGSTGSLPLELDAGGQRALRLEPNTASGSPNVIGGSSVNGVDPGFIGSTISGGGVANLSGITYSNRLTANFAAIGGGVGNYIQGDGSVVVGGYLNTIQNNGQVSSIGGGYLNSIVGSYSAIGGGYFNGIGTNANFSVIAGGYNNRIEATAGSSFIGSGSVNDIQGGISDSAITGGNHNTNGSSYSIIAGGNSNVIEPANDYSAIGGGWLNAVRTGSDQSVIAGGNANVIQGGARESFIGGGFANALRNGGANSFIGGGAANTNGSAVAVIGGGVGNAIGTNSGSSTVAGGSANIVFDNSSYDTIGGGFANTNSGQAATVAGGYQNRTAMNYATVGGGFQNFASGNINGAGDSATVAGGYQNAALGNNAAVGGGFANFARGDNAAIAGGWLNTNMTGNGFIGGGEVNLLEGFTRFSVIAGGGQNSIRTNSLYSVISGGQYQTIHTNSPYSMIAGGFSNEVAGAYAFAAGRRAKANHPGTLVWADSTDSDFVSTSSNQFLIRAGGGVGIGTTNPTAQLHVAGDTRIQGTLQLGSGTGSAEAPDRPLIIRRLKTTNLALGTVVARTDMLTLQRDGSSGGWQIINAASPGNTTIAATGVTSTGAAVNFVTSIAFNSGQGTNTVFNDGQNIVSFHCTFGDSYSPGQMTEVSLVRYPGDYFWTGTVTSTFNQ